MLPEELNYALEVIADGLEDLAGPDIQGLTDYDSAFRNIERLRAITDSAPAAKEAAKATEPLWLVFSKGDGFPKFDLFSNRDQAVEYADTVYPGWEHSGYTEVIALKVIGNKIPA